MTGHTKEPWVVERAHDIDAIAWVGQFAVLPADHATKGARGNTEDDARRIVACVNACQGLPTDELEQKGLVAEVLDLEQQRDDWQKALGAVLATIPNKEIVRVSGTVRDTVAYFKQLHQQRDGLRDAIGLAITIATELAQDENLYSHTKGTLTGLAEGLRMRVAKLC